METVKEVAVPPVVPLVPSENTFDFLNNRMYIIYIVLILIVLILIGVYLYRKYFMKSKDSKDLKDLKDVKESKQKPKEYLDNTKEYFLKDENGKEVNINPFLNDILLHKKINKDEVAEKLQNEYSELQRQKELFDQQVQEQMQQLNQMKSQMQQQMQQQQMPQQAQAQQHIPLSTQHAPEVLKSSGKKTRPKLSHPSEKSENIRLSDLEDENIAALNLTNEEMAELKKQLLTMKKSQKYEVSAQNDEDSE